MSKHPIIARTLARAGFHVGAFFGGLKIGASSSGWEGHEISRFRRRGRRELGSQDSTLNYGIREDLISEARRLGQTFPIVRRIKRQYSNHCVGSCRIKWATGDSTADTLYNKHWENWMNIADVNGIHHFKKLTKIVVSSTIGDGDIFGQLVDSSGWGQIRLIEGDRVSSDGMFNADTDRIVGGTILSASGYPAAIRVWRRDLFGSFKDSVEIPSSDYAHMMDGDRADAYRGVTHFHTVLNALKDLQETTLAEKLSAKRNSKLALLVKSVFGGAKTPAVDLFGDGEVYRGDGSGSRIDVQEVSDVVDAYMFPQEDIKAHSADRPSDGWHKLMEWMVREIATGLDLPFGVVWHMAGLGGPAARFEINQAARTFTAFTEILEQRWIRRIAGWVTAKSIKAGRLPFVPGWYQFKIARPAYITIDLGRDSKAGIEENKAGLYSATSWYAETDDDFEQETDRIGYEAAYRRTVAAKWGVDVSEIRESQQANNVRVSVGNQRARIEPQNDDETT